MVELPANLSGSQKQRFISSLTLHGNSKFYVALIRTASCIFFILGPRLKKQPTFGTLKGKRKEQESLWKCTMVRKAFACNWHTSYPLNFMANQTAEGCRTITYHGEAGQVTWERRMTVNNPPLGKGDKTCYQKYRSVSNMSPQQHTGAEKGRGVSNALSGQQEEGLTHSRMQGPLRVCPFTWTGQDLDTGLQAWLCWTRGQAQSKIFPQ